MIIPTCKFSILVVCTILNFCPLCDSSLATKSGNVTRNTLLFWNQKIIQYSLLLLDFHCPHPQQIYGSVYPNPINCSTFILCDDKGAASIIPCQSGMNFNPKTRICDKPRNVDCIIFPVVEEELHSIPSITHFSNNLYLIYQICQ